MALYEFAYSSYPLPPSPPFPIGHTAYRPIVVVHLRAPATGQLVTCTAVPDSGADQCVFPLSFAAALGLDTLKMQMDLVGGVGSTNTTYFEPLEIEIDISVPNAKIGFKTLAGFTAGLDPIGMGLLGQSGFFEAFQVMFDLKSKRFYIQG